jgi:hypothetical protein
MRPRSLLRLPSGFAKLRAAKLALDRRAAPQASLRRLRMKEARGVGWLRPKSLSLFLRSTKTGKAARQAAAPKVASLNLHNRPGCAVGWKGPSLTRLDNGPDNRPSNPKVPVDDLKMERNSENVRNG